MPSEESEERAAGFVLFTTGTAERKYLLLRHLHGGHWGFPKGRIEEGEGSLDAARREVREETGIDSIESIPVFRWTSRYRFDRGGRSVRKTVEYFLGAAAEHTIELSAEHTRGQWMSYEIARRTLTHEENRRILDSAESLLSDDFAIAKET